MSLQIRELRSGYRQGEVLHGVDLDVDPGQVLGILGRNGAGKTTLLHTLMNLIRPTSGSIRLDGQDLTGARPDRIAHTGITLVPQGHRIWPTVTVTEHLTLAKRRNTNRSWTTERIFDLFPQLATRHHHPAGQLSGGEQQMLAMARALVTEPSVILLDEPSEGLAPAAIDQIAQATHTMTQTGVAILLVEHDLHLVFDLTDTIAILAKGTIAHQTTTQAFRHDPHTANRLLGVTT